MTAATRGSDIRVRDDEDGDLAAIVALYAHYVLTGAASFEETPPEAAQMTRRRAEVLERGFPTWSPKATARSWASPTPGRSGTGPRIATRSRILPCSRTAGQQDVLTGCK